MWLLCPCVPSSISDVGYNCESKMENYKIFCNSFLLMQTIITVSFDDNVLTPKDVSVLPVAIT